MKAIWRLGSILVLVILVGCSDGLGPDQNGREVSRADLEGDWLIVNYWAEWCGPCRVEIPELNRLQERVRERGIRVIGVNFDGLQGDALQRSASAMNIRFTVLAKDPAERFGLPRGTVLPVTYLVDEQGRLRDERVGEQTADGLLARIEALRAEAP